MVTMIKHSRKIWLWKYRHPDWKTTNYRNIYFLSRYLTASVDTRFFIRTKYIRTLGFEAQNVKNILRTFLGFVDSKTCIFLGIGTKMAENAEIKNILRTYLGLNPKKLRTSGGFENFWCCYKTKRVPFSRWFFSQIPKYC